MSRRRGARERLPPLAVSVSPADYVEKTRLPSAKAPFGLIDEASESRDCPVAFMNAVILIIMQDKDIATNRNAILALIQLLMRHYKFLDMFPGEQRPEQLVFEGRELADYTKSMFLTCLMKTRA
jgi:hypothetical protein